MTERLTLKSLSGELETLRAQVQELEQQLERKITTTLEKAVDRLGSRTESTSTPMHGASIDTGHHMRLIAEEAYLIAEQRGFQGGDPEQDWAMAENRVNDRLMQKDSLGETAVPAKRPTAKKGRAKSASQAK